MSTDVNYSIKGTSDVPQQVDKAKKAMSDMERQTQAVGKKFTDFGKDLFMSFLAPMVLVHQAVNYISGAISKARQDAKDAVDFAAGIKVEDMSKSPVDSATRFLARKLQVEIRTEKEQEQAARARQVVTEEFLKRDPRGQQYYFERAPINPETGAPGISEFTMSLEKSTQDFVLGLAQIEAEKALKEEGAKGKSEGPSAQNIAMLSSNTVGVGMNAQFDMMNKQVALQEDIANYLRQLVEADQSRIGFQPQKYPDFGGSTQSDRTPLPPR